MLSLLFIHASRTKRKRIKRKVLPQSLPSPSSSSSLPFSSSSLPFSSSSLPFSSSSLPFSSSSRPLHLLPSFSSSFSPIAMQRRSAPASLPPPADDQRRQHSQQQTITVVENSRHRQNDDHSWTETSAQMSKSKSSRWSDIFGGWTGNGREGRKGSDGNSTEELIAAVQTLHSSSKMAAKSAEAQLKGAAILTKWAGKSNNEAMADVVARVGELMEMHAERQRTFAKDYGHYLRQLHKVAETERKMRAQCRRVEKLADEERRLGKMLVKKGGGDELSAQLERVKREREWAEREVEEERHEAEFARMAHLAAGLEGLADVQLNLARAGQLIFACQRELAAFVCKERPTEREGPTRQRHRYGGVPQTRQKMAELRRSLEAGEASDWEDGMSMAQQIDQLRA